MALNVPPPIQAPPQRPSPWDDITRMIMMLTQHRQQIAASQSEMRYRDAQTQQIVDQGARQASGDRAMAAQAVTMAQDDPNAMRQLSNSASPMAESEGIQKDYMRLPMTAQNWGAPQYARTSDVAMAVPAMQEGQKYRTEKAGQKASEASVRASDQGVVESKQRVETSKSENKRQDTLLEWQVKQIKNQIEQSQAAAAGDRKRQEQITHDMALADAQFGESVWESAVTKYQNQLNALMKSPEYASNPQAAEARAAKVAFNNFRIPSKEEFVAQHMTWAKQNVGKPNLGQLDADRKVQSVAEGLGIPPEQQKYVAQVLDQFKGNPEAAVAFMRDDLDKKDQTALPRLAAFVTTLINRPLNYDVLGGTDVRPSGNTTMSGGKVPDSSEANYLGGRKGHDIWGNEAKNKKESITRRIAELKKEKAQATTENAKNRYQQLIDEQQNKLKGG